MGNAAGAMIRMVRESRGMTQGDLAKLSGINQTSVSRYESGAMQPSDEHIGLLADALGFDREIFTLSETEHGIGHCTYYRKKKSVTVTKLKQLQATLNILHYQIKRLLEGVEIDWSCNFARLDLDEFGGEPEEVAKHVRATWNLPSGPVAHLIATIENAGGLVMKLPFGTKKIDAASQWDPPYPPIFFVNSEIPSDRMRFSLAHEMGHLLMHSLPSAQIEKEADRFAAEFLMPANDISGDLANLSIGRAARLKPFWRTSMWALIVRAHQLGAIGEWTYRNLCKMLSAQGHRIKEPIEISGEEATVISDVLATYRKDLEYTDDELVKVVFSRDSLYAYFLPGTLRIA